MKLEQLCKTETLVAITVALLVWRIYVTYDGLITFTESVISGIALMALGWFGFFRIFYLSTKISGWLKLDKIYRMIAFFILGIDIHILMDYTEKWMGYMSGEMIHFELGTPMDYFFRDVGYMVLVLTFVILIRVCYYLYGLFVALQEIK